MKMSSVNLFKYSKNRLMIEKETHTRRTRYFDISLTIFTLSKTYSGKINNLAKMLFCLTALLMTLSEKSSKNGW